MPVEIELLHNGRVMLYTYSGQISANDIIYSINQHTQQVLQTVQPVHVITDARDVTRLPVNMLSLMQRDLALIRHVTMGVAVIVTQSRVIITILNVLAKLIQVTDFRFVRTLDAAWSIVNHQLETEEST